MNTSFIVCGQKVDIGTRVVTWEEPQGFNAYDTSKYKVQEVDRRTGKTKTNVVSGVRYSKRTWIKNPSFPQLQGMVTQFFLHHSGLYRSRTTFDVLHKQRRLSCHFILDDDGTIYQTLDLREKAWHGGACNSVAVGIEIDSRAYASKFPTAYDLDSQKKYGVGPRAKSYDTIHGKSILGYCYNDAQYAALIRLAIGLNSVFPVISTHADFPRDGAGNIVKTNIRSPQKHMGYICHFHATRQKTDPIAFDFDRFLRGVRDKNPNIKFAAPGQDLAILEVENEQDYIDIDDWRDIQEALVELGYNPGVVDGVVGKNTRAALKSFQSNNGLVPDGIWGPRSKAAMEKAVRSKRNG